TVPGIVHIVGLGKTPLPVDDQELESVRVLVDSALPINPDESFPVGALVRVHSGPLTGACGCIAGLSQRRLTVTITLLQRSVSVEVNPEWIENEHPARASCAAPERLRSN